MQDTESKIYTSFLTGSKDVGVKQGMISALSAGFYAGVIYLAYAYSFWLGGLCSVFVSFLDFCLPLHFYSGHTG